MRVKAGSTDVTTYFHLRLAADGTDATGLTIANIDLQYVRSGAAPSTKADAVALAAADSAHTDNRAFEIDGTDQPGVYRVDWPDAAFAAGVPEVILTVKCASVFTESLRVELRVNTEADIVTAIGTAGASLTAIPWNAAWDAEVQSEVDDGLIAKGLDHLVFTSVAGTDIADNSIVAKLSSKSATADWDSFDNTTDSLEALRDSGTTVAAMVDAVWDEAISGHLTAGTTGAALEDATAPSAAVVAAAVWDLTTTGHANAGTFGEQCKTDIDAILVDTGTTLDSKIDTIDSVVDAILEDTGTTLQAEVDGIQADTEDIQARIPAALTAGGNMKTDILAVSGDATAADRLEAVMDGVIVGAINDAAASTTAFIVDGFTEATNDHFNGRLITFTSGVLLGQQRTITDYVGATQTITVDALTEAPGNNDTFFIS